MKKPFLAVFLSFFVVCFCFANDPLIAYLQTDFFGTWYYGKTDMYYTITNDRLIAFQTNLNEGFTVIISNWEIVYNNGKDSNEYPVGFKISGTIEDMTGNWWIDIGDFDTWIWYLKTDKSSLITYDTDDGGGDSYVYIKQ